MAEEQQQQQQQQEQQEQINNQSRLPSDWFYSSVMLTNRLDIGEHTGIGSFQMNHLEQNDQSLITCNNFPDPGILRICQTTDASNDIYRSVVTTASSFLSKSSFQISCPGIPIPDDDKIVENQNILVKGSNTDDTDFAISNSDFLITNQSSLHNCNHITLQTQHRNNQSYMTLICNNDDDDDDNNDDNDNDSNNSSNIGSSKSSRKNDNIQLERIEKLKDSDGGDDEGAPPSNVLYSHSTTNSSDKMKWDCGVRWPSAKRIGMLTSSYSVNIDTYNGSRAVSDDGTIATMDIPDNSGMIESTTIDSKFVENTGEVIQEMEVITNTTLDKDESNDITVSEATMQFNDESNLTDPITATTVEATFSPLAQQLSSKIESDEQPLSSAASIESLSLPSIKVPIKKRLIHSSLTSVPYNNSAKTTNACMDIPSNTYDTLSEHRQLLPTTIISDATVTRTAIESAFSSCYQMIATGSTGTIINEDSVPAATTIPKLLTGNDFYWNILNNHAVRIMPNSDSQPVMTTNSLSEAEIVNLLCRNLCDIERIIAQQRIAYSSTPSIQLQSLLSQCNNGEQKSQLGYTDSVIVSDHEHEQQQYRHHHNVAMERRRSHTVDSSNTRRFHPYATTTTATKTTTTTRTAPTTACCSNNITVWSPSVPSRADLKQKYLRSLAPVLYDLLTDDCESKNCQKTTDSVDCSILKSYVEPSMDSYFRSLSLLAATASLPFVNNKFDHLPFNYIDYFTLQQCSLLLGSAPSTDLLKLAQSANLLYNAAVTTPTTLPGTVLSDKIPFASKIDQHSASNSINGSYPQSSQQSTMLTVDNEPSC